MERGAAKTRQRSHLMGYGCIARHKKEVKSAQKKEGKTRGLMVGSR